MSDPPLGVTGIRPQSRIHNSPHPRQVRAKQEEEREHLNLRRHVANATSAALPPIPNGIRIGDIAADMADVIRSIAAELAPRPKHPRGPQGWCADPGVQAKMNAAWQQREEARKQTARCWTLMTETCLTKTANYYSVSQETTNLLF